MLKAISAILPCSCLPWSKQADKKVKAAVPYESTSKQPSPIQPPTTNQQQQQDSVQDPVQEDVSLWLPTEDDPETTITAIEALLEPNNEDETDHNHDDEEQTELKTGSRRASAPPNLELNIPRDPLPDFSLNSRSRLSYWGPPPFLPPARPLPDSPTIRPCQPCGAPTEPHSFYSAYYRGEETVTRILLSKPSNLRLATVLPRSA